MANIQIQWSANSNTNTTGQKTFNRKKGTTPWLETFFTSQNILGPGVQSNTFTNAIENNIYEFQVSSICSEGGPSFNTNGIQQGIVFGCIQPTQSATDTTVTISVANIPTDITKIRFSLFNGATQVQTSQDVLVSTGNASRIFEGLSPNTPYVGKIQLITTLNNGVERVSNLTCEVNAPTGNPATCLAPTNLTPQCVNCASLT